MDMTGEKARRRKWYENYLPFVAKNPRMQIDWLIAAFEKGSLTHEEITPYIKLLLDESQDDEIVRELLRPLGEWVLTEMLRAADIYDTPKLFRFIPRPTLVQTKLALGKTPPPYEKMVGPVRDKVFRAVYDSSEELLAQAVEDLRKSGEITAEFEVAYERFNEILMDAKILSSLYPKAKLQPESL
jgi:hypothetical protein